jgi:hypothetical protein
MTEGERSTICISSQVCCPIDCKFCLMALLFIVLLMYRMMTNEDAANAPAPVDQATAEEQAILPDPPPANSKPSEPSKPDKPPPLNER